MDTLRELAARLDEAAATLTSAAGAVAREGPPGSAFGADGPGRLAELGRALHGQWVAATDARAREAADTAARLADAAAAVRLAARGYAGTDAAAAARLAARGYGDSPGPGAAGRHGPGVGRHPGEEG